MKASSNDFPQQPENTTPSTDNANNILLNNFQIKKRRYRVLLHVDHLVWERMNLKSSDKNTKKKETEFEAQKLEQYSAYGNNSKIVHIDEIVCIGKGSTKAASLKPSTLSTTTTTTLTSDTLTEQYLSIRYAQRIVKSASDCNRWRLRKLTLYSTDGYIVRQWHEALHKLLSINKPTRLRVQRLLVFINPYGGRQQGLKVYEQYCKPIFQLAGIDASCIISQRSNQIRDILLSHDLTLYDAICCVGGDGTVAEVINGLLFRSIRDLGLDLARPAFIPKPTLPVGVIPAGSTDTIAFSLHGTADAQTAAIHLVLGQRRGLDVCSVRNKHGLLRFCASVLSYGYLGDVAAKSEKYRWLGTKRYEFVGVKAFLLNRSYEAVIRLPDKIAIDDDEQTVLTKSESVATNIAAVCTVNCRRCNSMTEECNLNPSISGSADTAEMLSNNGYKRQSYDSILTTSTVSEQWRELRGKFFMISGTNISCSCTRSPNGISPSNHLGDGYLDLILVHKTTLLNNVRLLLKSMNKNGDIRTLPFVESHRTKTFQFQVTKASNAVENCSMSGSCQPIVNNCVTANASTEILPSTAVSSWNCDGEVVIDLEITMISHCQLIDVFMRGPYTYTNQSCSDSFPNCYSCCGT